MGWKKQKSATSQALSFVPHISQANTSYSSLISGYVWGEEARSFATIKLKPGLKSYCIFSKDSQSLHVITDDGMVLPNFPFVVFLLKSSLSGQ